MPGARRRFGRNELAHHSRQHRGITEVRRSSDFAHAVTVAIVYCWSSSMPISKAIGLSSSSASAAGSPTSCNRPV
jgi:hypothetical protein